MKRAFTSFVKRILGLAVFLLFLPVTPSASAFEFLKDAAAAGAAFMTHLSLHEIGHQVVADKVGTDSNHMKFFKKKEGKFYFGVSAAKGISKKSILPYAVGGEWMAGYTFEYALQSYHRKPTTYHKALMFFSCTEFLWYTLYANYVSPGDDNFDPNLIRREAGLSKEALLSLGVAKSVMNAYRIFNKDANFIPMITVDKSSAAFMIRFNF